MNLDDQREFTRQMHKRIKEVIELYNNCTGGKWFNADQQDLDELENLANLAMVYVRRGDWDDALRWSKRCVEMEKKVGFENAPIWGEFGEAIEIIHEKLLEFESLLKPRTTW